MSFGPTWKPWLGGQGNSRENIDLALRTVAAVPKLDGFREQFGGDPAEAEGLTQETFLPPRNAPSRARSIARAFRA